MRWILLMVLMFMVSGCSGATWSQMHQAGMRSLAAHNNGLSSALNAAATQKIVSAFTYTGNHHAEYIRNKQLNRNKEAMIAGYCLTDPMVSNRAEYDSCLYANGILR